MRIWIDTDIGSDVDDALALAYILRHSGFELVGVSTVFGDVDLRTRIAEVLLAEAGRADVPVISGLAKPLTPRRNGVMFGHEGRGMLADPKPVMRITKEMGNGESRIEALAEALAGAEPDVLLAIGPLTNLGALARANVALPPLAVMGGKFVDEPIEGASGGIEEWNWFSDPDAVRLVLAAPAATPPLVVPAEVTFRTRLAEGDVERLAAGDPVARMVAGLCNEWLEIQRQSFGRTEPRVALHDPLAAAVLVEQTLCQFETQTVAIDDHGFARSDNDAGHVVSVAVDVAAEAARQHLMATLV